jgi:hypothetical protein
MYLGGGGGRFKIKTIWREAILFDNYETWHLVRCESTLLSTTIIYSFIYLFNTLLVFVTDIWQDLHVTNTLKMFAKRKQCLQRVYKSIRVWANWKFLNTIIVCNNSCGPHFVLFQFTVVSSLINESPNHWRHFVNLLHHFSFRTYYKRHCYRRHWEHLTISLLQGIITIIVVVFVVIVIHCQWVWGPVSNTMARNLTIERGLRMSAENGWTVED